MRGRALCHNTDQLLTPGLFGTHRGCRARSSYRGVLLPDEAIATDQDRRLVWVVADDNSVSAAGGAAGAAHRRLPPGPQRA